MKTALTTATALVLLLLAGTLPAAAGPFDGVRLSGAATEPVEEPTEEPWEPNLVTERAYFTCSARVSNTSGDGAGWHTDPPAGSVFEGEGCTAVDPGEPGDGHGDTRYNAVFTGQFEGNLDTLTVELFALAPGTADPRDLSVGLMADGLPLLAWPTDVTAPSESSNEGVTETLAFTVTGIDLLAEADDAVHELELTISARGQFTAWVWDNEEVPAGITFNPEEADGVEVEALPRAERHPEGDDGEDPDPGPGLPVGPVVVAPPLAQSIGYANGDVATLQGGTLFIANTDNVQHDIVSRDRDSSGRHIFASDYTNLGEVEQVHGVEDLPPGEYGFYCSLHGGMTGVLDVLG